MAIGTLLEAGLVLLLLGLIAAVGVLLGGRAIGALRFTRGYRAAPPLAGSIPPERHRANFAAAAR